MKNSTPPPSVLPLEYAAEVMLELNAMRSECGDAARDLIQQGTLDGPELEECSMLDDALADAAALLQGAIHSIILSKARRRNAQA
jgi:hypothetical protein